MEQRQCSYPEFFNVRFVNGDKRGLIVGLQPHTPHFFRKRCFVCVCRTEQRWVGLQGTQTESSVVTNFCYLERSVGSNWTDRICHDERWRRSEKVYS